MCLLDFALGSLKSFGPVAEFNNSNKTKTAFLRQKYDCV